ncbi:hypothetical protein DLAC_05722 [Tieghemostelium lacteum]|uniref:Uncharacterized protein n=1 Tax=Tieghemostelium lacteum TaxID=361077 RepID=A0A151ZGQ2_TIELA|nr:hypothetical protein DLAC_05722 [Tieghemostelium lacteum]|eukprot:KYQ93097.1 hypothetical protein DLAC_05722 [Tieghemostelium lacteum]
MTAEEILTGAVSKDWIDDLPLVIKAMNKKFNRIKKDMKLLSDIPVCEGDSCQLLEMGTKVRAILDDYTTDKRLHGKFRAGDIKLSPEVRYIKKIILKPGFSPMYLLNKGENDGLDLVTKNQLQVINPDEENQIQV